MKKRKLTKTSIIAIIILVVLITAFAIFLPIYLNSNEDNRQLYSDQKIKFTAYGRDVGTYSIDDLLTLENVVETVFSAVYDTSSSDAVTKNYTGIEVKKILIALGVDLSVARTIVFEASDGAQKAYTIDDIIKADNVFLAYKVNNKPFNTGINSLAYTKEQEDGGPFVIIKVSDLFSQNRCKLLTEINVK